MSSSLKRACEGVRSNNVTLYLITAVVLVTCFAIAVPFLPALIGAITLSVITQRPFEWLEAKCGPWHIPEWLPEKNVQGGLQSP
jgi:predicted PurR-regulated permease PerM